MSQHLQVSIANLREGHWRVRLDPAWRTIFDAIFRGCEVEGDELIVADTPKNARDLLWFSDRIPMVFRPELHLLSQASLQDEREGTIRKILSPDYVPSDPRLALALRSYQAKSVDLTIANYGVLVGDEVGLGKTAQGIALCARRDALPAVVVTLTSLPIQWQREFKKFAPELRTHVIKTASPYPLNYARGRQIPRPDVLIMSYSKLTTQMGRSWAEVIANEGLANSLVLDEAHELRNHDTARYRAVRMIRDGATWCMGMTATPVINHGAEIFNVVDIIQPGALGTRKEFLKSWCGKSEDQAASIDAGAQKTPAMRKTRVTDPVALGHHLRDIGVFIRRTRKEVGRELPPFSRVFHEVDPDHTLDETSMEELDRLCRVVLSGVGAKGPGGLRKAAGELDYKLRRATGVAKAMHAVNFVRLLISGGERVVLYGYHHDVYDIWKKAFSDPTFGDLKPAFFTGEESASQKEESRRRFIEKETPLFIISTRAGAGLDGIQYSGCRVVVFAEFDWSPGITEQCLSEDTEILTIDGFKGVDDVVVGTMVCGFDRTTGNMRWVPALTKVHRPLANGEKMFAVRTEKTDLRVTGGHRLVVRRKRRTSAGVGRSEWELDTADYVAGQARRFIPVSGYQEGKGVPLRDCDLRLLGWYITDGSFDGRTLTIYQAAYQPWNKDIVETLTACGLKWRRSQRIVPSGTLMNMYCVQPDEDLNGNLRWTFQQETSLLTMREKGVSWEKVAAHIGKSVIACQKKWKKLQKPQKPWIGSRVGRGWTYLGKYLDKDLSPHLEEMTRAQLLQFLHGVKMGDGVKNPRLKNVMLITGANEVMFDRLQSLCVRRGLSARQSVSAIPTHRPGDLVQRAHLHPRRLWIEDIQEASLPRRDKKNGFGEVPTTPGEKVWCVSNELETLVTRRNGRVAIVGNCAGRVYRDGQPDPVTAYYLWTNWGADPVMLDALNLKTEQSEGIRNLVANASAELEGTSPDQIKKLASAFLQQRGKT